MDGDPPLGDCPPWCQKEKGHGWEDEWLEGPVRYHTYRREVKTYHEIGLDEIEQWVTRADTPQATVGVMGQGYRRRMREIILDVESPTQWDLAESLAGLVEMAEVVSMAAPDWPTGEVR